MSTQTRQTLRLPRFPFRHIFTIISLIVLLTPSIGKATATPETAPVVVSATASDWGEVGGQVLSDTPSNTSPAGSASLADANSWPMAGANPQRTSWTPEEVRGQLKPIWYIPIEPYISKKVQIIAADSTLFISTARGLYALNADTGDVKWVYATEMPLGNSPTVYNGVVYVGGFDHKLHAINEANGQRLWVFEAEAGFDTNPLVINNLVYLGNRDGYFYAIYSNDDAQKKGQLDWKFKTNGPIHFSAAYQNNTIFFASDDSFAYALNATTGQQVWKSAKLPGAGFHSWWPVIYQNKVIFAGSNNYRVGLEPFAVANGASIYDSSLDRLDRNDIYPSFAGKPRGDYIGTVGQVLGDWVAGTKTVDASRITNYFESKPWRRTYFVLDQATGGEYTFADNQGQAAYAPILWHGTKNGNRYPPVIGSDGVLYQSNDYQYDPSISSGHISGWKFGTPIISVATPRWSPIDEPDAYAAGGRVIYWSHQCDSQAGAFDISVPVTSGDSSTRDWLYFDWGQLQGMIPGYSAMYEQVLDGWEIYSDGSVNGVYGCQSDMNPPIPYKGKVYLQRSNAIIAFGNYSGQPTKLPLAPAVIAQNADVKPVSSDQLRQRLATEIQKMINAGHLRPGYASSGIFDHVASSICGDDLLDYWHNPSDTLLTLAEAMPYLPSDLQLRTKAYLQSEFAAYPPYQYTHIGWQGAGREAFDLPPEVQNDLANFPPSAGTSDDFEGWGARSNNPTYPPYMFYAMWKYAQVTDNPRQTAQNILSHSTNPDGSSKLKSAPSDAILAKYPFAHNAFIAGYLGYLGLEQLAGRTETSGIRNEYNRLLALRATNFSKNTVYLGSTNYDDFYCKSLNVARNFMFLVPELGQYLHDNALSRVKTALDEYNTVAPLWFVAFTEQANGENTVQHYYDVNAIFQAKALILQQPRDELIKYLDVPAFAIGDLFYIQNLTATIDKQGIDKVASQLVARQGDVIAYTLTIGDPLLPTVPITVTDTWPQGLKYNNGSCSSSSLGTLTCSNNMVTWSGNLPSTDLVISYTVQVTTSLPSRITNQMQVDGGPQGIYNRSVSVMVNPVKCYLPRISIGR